jgi:hypothetical protein
MGRSSVSLWIIVICAAVLLCSCGGEQRTDGTVATQTNELPTSSLSDRPAQQARNGMELYAWQSQEGDWVFSVLHGTKELKSWEQVQANPLNLDVVKRRFLEMAVGEHVFGGRVALSTASGSFVALTEPPADPQTRLEEIAAECEVELIVPALWNEESVD